MKHKRPNQSRSTEDQINPEAQKTKTIKDCRRPNNQEARRPEDQSNQDAQKTKTVKKL